MYEIGKLPTLHLGRQGEKGAANIQIDVTPWKKEYPECGISLVVVRPEEEREAAYIADASWTHDGETGQYILGWIPGSGDTATAGMGWAEVRAAVMGESGVEVIKKSVTVRTIIAPSLQAGSETPGETEAGWIDTLTALAGEVRDGAEAATEAAERAESASAAAATSERNAMNYSFTAQMRMVEAGDYANAAGDSAQQARRAASDAKAEAQISTLKATAAEKSADTAAEAATKAEAWAQSAGASANNATLEAAEATLQADRAEEAAGVAYEHRQAAHEHEEATRELLQRAQGAEGNANQRAAEAQAAATVAGNAASAAEEAADRAEMAAEKSGYMAFELREDGHLYYLHTDNVEAIDFEIQDGRLVGIWR